MFGPENEGVEYGADDEGCGEGGVPFVADVAVESKDVFESEIGDGDEDDVEADDDEGADGEIGNDGWCQSIKDFASIEHPKEEQYVDGVEESYM